MRKEIIREGKLSFKGKPVSEYEIKITMNKGEFEEIKDILWITTDKLQRKHKVDIINYILEDNNYPEIFNEYNIFYSSRGNEVNFWYNALSYEDIESILLPA